MEEIIRHEVVCRHHGNLVFCAPTHDRIAQEEPPLQMDDLRLELGNCTINGGTNTDWPAHPKIPVDQGRVGAHSEQRYALKMVVMRLQISTGADDEHLVACKNQLLGEPVREIRAAVKVRRIAVEHLQYSHFHHFSLISMPTNVLPNNAQAYATVCNTFEPAGRIAAFPNHAFSQGSVSGTVLSGLYSAKVLSLDTQGLLFDQAVCLWHGAAKTIGTIASKFPFLQRHVAHLLGLLISYFLLTIFDMLPI